MVYFILPVDVSSPTSALCAYMRQKGRERESERGRVREIGRERQTDRQTDRLTKIKS